ncbi:MAG TPA: hypothetical protein VFD05_02245 [Bacilli bacterium]|nr:hypothetical protein [Bacilli bacterium]
MRKSIKGFYSFFLTIALLCSCNNINNSPELKGKFWCLEEAYLNEFLTISNLNILAQYINKSILPENLAPLDPTYEKAIIESAVEWYSMFPEDVNIAKHEYVYIDTYYGTYGDCVVVKFGNTQIREFGWIYSEDTTIGGVDFHFRSIYKPMVWKAL